MGGPLGPGGRQPVTRPIPGTVRFTDARHRVVRVRVGRSGTFSVGLPAGTYTASGRSPRVVEVDGGTVRQTPCTQPRRVTVTAGHSTHVTLACVVP
jgi:hypothetical protein